MTQGQICAAWWRELQPTADKPGDRASLARLRRAGTVTDAAQEPVTVQLARRLGGVGWLERAALVVAVLAHVRTDQPGIPCARAVGPTQDGNAAMSALRLRRLLTSDTPEEKLVAFRRMAALAGGTLNVTDLASALLYWNDQTRQRWIYAYYDAASAAPTAATPDAATPDAVTEDATA
jgi:CRISPR system Cascade subunit CasB